MSVGISAARYNRSRALTRCPSGSITDRTVWMKAIRPPISDRPV
jgi:hypothetical protein